MIVLVAIPIIAKNYINSNGKDLISRKISIESLSVNYLTGALDLGNLLIYENNDVDTFLYVNRIYLNLNVIACIQQEYTIQDVEVDRVKCNIVLTNSNFNFDSIIDHFADTTEIEEEESAPVHFTLEKISLTNSYFSYKDENLNSFVALNNFNTYLPQGVSWNNPELNILSDFGFITGGKINSKFNFNSENGDYDLKLNSEKINLTILLPYLQDFIAIKEINGTLNSNLFLEGNTEESANIDIEGSFDLRNLSITDTLNTKLAGLNKLNVNVNSVNPAKDIYEISAIKIDSLYVNYEVYPQTDNFTQLFKLADSTQVVTEEESTSNVFVMIKDYVVEALHGIKASNFSIDTLALSNFDLLYFDHSILQEFKYRISETNLTAYAVKSDADSLVVSLTSLLNNKGKLKATATLHPKKPEDLTISLSIEKTGHERFVTIFSSVCCLSSYKRIIEYDL